MLEELLKSIPVFFLSMLKFILGPATGFAAGLHFVTTAIVTVCGMMTMVVILSFSGEYVRAKLGRKSAATQGSRWKKYGLPGIALLTPLFLTPIGGTLLALGSGYPKEKIIFYMFVSAALWSLIFTGAVFILGSKVLHFLPEFAR